MVEVEIKPNAPNERRVEGEEPTVGRELVSFKHSDTQDVLLQVLYEKLTIGIPLGIQRILLKEDRKGQESGGVRS